MTSTPEPDAAAALEGAASEHPVTEGHVSEHHIPEPEAGEGEWPESAATEPSHEAPIDHAPAHAEQAAAESGAESGAESATEPAVEASAAETAATHREQPAPEPTTPTMQELELALAALDEIAPAGAVGEVQDALAEGGAHGQAHVVAIRHASTLAGYPDWSWTVLLSRGLEGGPTVLEVALLPGETSLLAPAWVPWSERLADYLAAKDEADSHDGADDEDELESDLDADLDDDFDDDYDVDEADVEDDDDEADVEDDADWDDDSSDDDDDDSDAGAPGEQRN